MLFWRYYYLVLFFHWLTNVVMMWPARVCWWNWKKSFSHYFHVSIQNYTADNHTQGIMEKSQWDLKKVRMQQRRFTRFDDFVAMHKVSLDGLLLEYADAVRSRRQKVASLLLEHAISKVCIDSVIRCDPKMPLWVLWVHNVQISDVWIQ